jgi:hypothetical protein
MPSDRGAPGRVHPYVWSACILALAIALVVALEPLGGHWETGDGYEVCYPASAASLVGGGEPGCLDHPGVPLQEAIALAMTVTWAAAPRGESRDERADRLIADIDGMRPYVRGVAIAATFASAVTVLLVVGGMLGAWWGLLGALLFLGAPGLTTIVIFPAPDYILGAACLWIVALLVRAARTRSASAYLAAAVTTGFAVSVKIHALGLVPVLVSALVLWPPGAGWLASVRAAVGRRRRLLGAIAGTWLVLAAGVNALEGLPSLAGLGRFATNAAVVGAVLVVLALAVRATRFRATGDVLAAAALAALAGFVLPNLVFARAVPEALRSLTDALHGGGVNSDVHAFTGSLYPPRPWLPLCALAVVGLVRALRASQREHVLWAVAAVALGAVALSRTAVIHYWAPTVIVLIPLALLALRGRRETPHVAAVAAVLLLLVVPFKSGINDARVTGKAIEEVQRIREAVRARLGPDEVAVATMNEFQRYPHIWAKTEPDTATRILPAVQPAVAYTRRHNLRVRYLIDITGAPEAIAAGLGLRVLRAEPGIPHTFVVTGR